MMQIDSIKRRGTIACICGDGISYPEKFISEMLNQLNIDYICQLSKRNFNWCKDYRYDFYLPTYNIIIEANGRQHYKDCKWTKVKNVQINDTYKKELANKNNISKYITIDCRYSELDWVKESVFKSDISKLFDVSIVDWKRCEEFALNNKVKEVCDYWNSKKDSETIKDLAKVFNLSDVTIRKYLNNGNKINWCNYDGKLEMIKSGKSRVEVGRKKVEVFKENTYLGIFESCTELSEKSKDIFGIKLNLTNISQVCTGYRKSHKGFTFKYIDENQKISA